MNRFGEISSSFQIPNVDLHVCNFALFPRQIHFLSDFFRSLRGPNEEQEDFTPVIVDKPQIKYEAADSTQDDDDDRSIQGKTDTSSHTSLATNYSERLVNE